MPVSKVKENPLDVNSYLKRISYRGPLAPTAETLRALQVSHLLTVPFENLSIHRGEPIELETQALYAKIVGRRRGGFCYEANGLLAALLGALGFQVEMLSAQVAGADGNFGPEFDHLALMVTLKDRWLVDVGFGDSFREPLSLAEPGGEHSQGRSTFKILPEANRLVLMRRETGDEWKPQYRFTLRPFELSDFGEMCRYHQSSPRSHFTRRRICSRATEDGGRFTLSEMRFIKTLENGGRQEQILTSQTEYDRILREFFGIVMPN